MVKNALERTGQQFCHRTSQYRLFPLCILFKSNIKLEYQFYVSFNKDTLPSLSMKEIGPGFDVDTNYDPPATSLLNPCVVCVYECAYLHYYYLGIIDSFAVNQIVIISKIGVTRQNRCHCGLDDIAFPVMCITNCIYIYIYCM
jgi:hypothetical protein